MKEIERYLKIFKNSSYIFNLGHGILPNTKPKTLERVILKVNNFKC